MKVPLSEQIEEARIHRDALQAAVEGKPHLMPRLHRSEALLLTVTAYAAYADEIARADRAKTRKDER